MSDRTERIFFFKGSKNRRLLGFLHLPISATPKTGLVYCHPFADEQSLSHRIAVETSRKIAELGFPVLRFDFSGCGDSEGELYEVSRSDWQEDLQAAIDCLKAETRIQNTRLWGLRLGGSLALLHAIRDSTIDSLLLWQPITNFDSYFKQFMKREVLAYLPENHSGHMSIEAPFHELSQKGQVNVIGYPISKFFLDGFGDLDKNEFDFQQPVCNCTILSVSLMEQPPRALKDFAEKLKKNGTDVRLKHVIADSFWDRYWRWSCPEIWNETTHWLKDCS